MKRSDLSLKRPPGRSERAAAGRFHRALACRRLLAGALALAAVAGAPRSASPAWTVCHGPVDESFDERTDCSAILELEVEESARACRERGFDGWTASERRARVDAFFRRRCGGAVIQLDRR